MLRQALKKIPGARRMAQSIGVVPPDDPGRQFLIKILPKRSVGAEIGVHLGEFSQTLIDFVRPRELHLIDPWEYQESEPYKTALFGGKVSGGQAAMDARYQDVLSRFGSKIRDGSVIVHRGYSTDALEKIPDAHLDWVYIDGNHLYEYVKKDLELSLRKVKSGGYIAGDDYELKGWWDDGVTRAVDEFSSNPGVRLLATRNNQFVLRKL